MAGKDPRFWFLALCLAGAAVYSFAYCFLTWRKNRVVEDTPTSRIRSAAQGYVEFTGHGLMLDGHNKAPLTHTPCTWWRYEIEERGWNGRWRFRTTIQSDTSTARFILDDGTGQCLVDPCGADVYPDANDVWYGSSEWPEIRIPSPPGLVGWILDVFAGGKYRYTEHRLMPREKLYAIGSFDTRGGGGAETPDGAVNALLHDWKQDQKSLLARFDANHDGSLSADEWERARIAAREQVMDGWSRRPSIPPMNVLSKPADGRAFLLAACDEVSLARKLRLRAAGGVAVFAGSVGALTWMLTRL